MADYYDDDDGPFGLGDRKRMRRRRMMGRRVRRAGFGKSKPLLAERLGGQRLALLRSVNNPVKTAMAGTEHTAAAAGEVTSTLTVQGMVPAGAVLWVVPDANTESITSILADGQNIYTGGNVPAAAADASNQNAAGILISRPIQNTLTVTIKFGAAGNAQTWLETASLEVEQTLDAAEDCD